MNEENGNGGKSNWKGGKIFIALIGGLLGIFLLVSGGRSDTKDSDKTAEDSGGFEQRLTMEEYRAAIEARVCAISAQVAGVGEAVAIVSLEGGFEYVYATDVKVSSAGESMQYIVIGSGSDESLVYLTEKVPKICGIGVVCDGGDDARIKRELTYLLSAAFEVPTNKIYVTRKK
ncbi:MAG: hypothetical protein IJX74_01000 [Clostridia bacterium]|nr:hypothetical protein [Clostridia bacterium]